MSSQVSLQRPEADPLRAQALGGDSRNAACALWQCTSKEKEILSIVC